MQQVQSSAQVRLLLPVLDRGEAEVIALALEQQAKLVLLDELTGRKVAQSLELPVTGTAGILIRAKQKGLILLRSGRCLRKCGSAASATASGSSKLC